MLNAGFIILCIDRWNVDPDALSCNNLADALLEQVQIVRRHSICLCNDRNEIDTCAETLHNLDIERLQAMRLLVRIARLWETCNVRVPGRPDEEKTSMNPEVGLLTALGLLLLSHVGFMLIIDEVNDRSPRITVVDVVSKPGGINNGEFDFERFLF